MPQLLMKFSTNKYLFYKCYLNWCYYVMCAAFNLSICKMDRQGMQIQSVIHCAKHRWKHRRFMFVSVFQRQRELFPSTRHCSLYKPLMEIPTICVCRCIPDMRGTVPLHQELFTMQTIDGNTNSLCPSVYSRGKGNCSSPPSTVHHQQHRGKHRRFVSVVVFQR